MARKRVQVQIFAEYDLPLLTVDPPETIMDYEESYVREEATLLFPDDAIVNIIFKEKPATSTGLEEV